VKAACALHNWIQKNGTSSNSTPVDIEHTEMGHIIPGSWHNDSDHSDLIYLGTQMQQNFTTEAKPKRNYFADHFIGEGAVNWQNRMID